MDEYDPLYAEAVCQKFWEENDLFHAECDSPAHKRYILTQLQQPVSNGPHLAEQQPYIIADVLARYCRASQCSVLFPIGYNAFNTQNEHIADKTNHKPKDISQDNTQFYSEAIRRLGYSHDPLREIDTSNSDYIKWVQWLFLLLWDTYFDETRQVSCPIRELTLPPEVQRQGDKVIREYRNCKRLIYFIRGQVFYCPKLKILLHSSDVENSYSKEGNYYCHGTSCTFWKLRLNPCGGRLLKGLKDLDWPKKVIDDHTNWIGEQEYVYDGEEYLQYKLEDVIISSPNYWGVPIPLLHEIDSDGKATGKVEMDQELPVLLPDLDNRISSERYSALENAKDWLFVEKGGKQYKRDTSVLPSWFCNLAAYLRFTDPNNSGFLARTDKHKQWLPADVYITSNTKEIMCWRFIHKVLHDRGLASDPEPFTKLITCGRLFTPEPYTGYRRSDSWVSVEDADATCSEVGLREDQITKGHLEKYFVLKEDSGIYLLNKEGVIKKNGSNMLNINRYLDLYGGDAIRFYLLSIPGISEDRTIDPFKFVEFLNQIRKIYKTVLDLNEKGQSNSISHYHRLRTNIMLKKIKQAIETIKFDKACDVILDFSKWLSEQPAVCGSVLKKYIIAIHPFLPYLSEVLWGKVAKEGSVISQEFPQTTSKDDELYYDLPVKINREVKTHLILHKDISIHELKEKALEVLGEKFDREELEKVIIVPGRSIEILTKNNI